MKSMIALMGISLLAAAPSLAQTDTRLAETTALAQEITTNGKAFRDLSELTTQIGPRLVGSSKAADAVVWAKAKLESYGFENVTLQPTMVPVWTRGDVTNATLIDGATHTALAICALGGSVATAVGGIDAEVVEVQSVDEVARLGTAVRGKIVFFNRPMDASLPDTFHAYSGAIDQRTAGAIAAARQGAVASIVRTLTTLPDDDHPHTGSVSYRSDVSKIPAAAVSTHGANLLSQHLQANPHLTVHIELSSALHSPTQSYNVYGEITGSEHPEEIVVVGGHLDSWDLGVGAQDDGAGVVQSIEVLRAMKALGMRPKRTVRVVLFMGEEYGAAGARDYAAAAKASTTTRHIAAIESDRGGFAPLGFSMDASPSVEAKMRAWAPILAPLHADGLIMDGSGTDVGPLNAPTTATMELTPVSTHYFDFHHAATDQLAAVNPTELLQGAAAMAAVAWLFGNDD